MKTEILCLLDRSGSMQNIIYDSIGGYNAFIEQQKAVPGEARVTTILFDDKYEVLYSAAPLSDVKEIDITTYYPRGGTALLDAMGFMLSREGERIRKEGWAEKVIVCIITDGEENASREYKQDQVTALTKEAEEIHGWSFVFLAANQDAFKAAAHVGINPLRASNAVGAYHADSFGTQSAYATMSASAANFRGGPDLKAKTDITFVNNLPSDVNVTVTPPGPTTGTTVKIDPAVENSKT